MCMQCLVNSVSVGTDQIIPQYYLLRSTKAAYADPNFEEWPLGWYGFVRKDDPDFVFPPPTPNLEPKSAAYYREVARFGECFRKSLDANKIVDFMAAARKAGYSKRKTRHFEQWLYDWCVKWIQTHKEFTDKDLDHLFWQSEEGLAVLKKIKNKEIPMTNVSKESGWDFYEYDTNEEWLAAMLKKYDPEGKL